MKVNNKIRTASVNQYCGAFPNSDWPEIVTHNRKTCVESPQKRLARSNGRIENYDSCHKPGLLCFLRQNPNLTLGRITRLNRIFPSLFKKSHPRILNRISSDFSSLLCLQNSLITNTFLQQHCIEVVTDKNFK